MDLLYNKLDLKKIKAKDKEKFEKSIKRGFHCQEVSVFNPNYTLFSLDDLDLKKFNSKTEIVKLLKKKKNKKIHINGHIYKALLKSEKKYFFKDIFCKECPCYNPLNITLNVDKVCGIYEQFVINDSINNINSQVNIEVFISYLLSKLVENKISPNFPLFFGNSFAILNKYTSEINNKEIALIQDNTSVNYRLFIGNNISYLERYNFPVNIIFSEKMDNDLYNYIYDKPYIDDSEWLSIIFQIILGLTSCQKYFKIYHNDLHLSNIMFSNTKLEYLYYSYNNVYFKVPTYSKIIKIIDWGRATYNFNGFKGNNFIFRKDGDAFGQYYYNKINKKGKKNIDPNPSFDLALLGCNLSIEPLFPKKGKLFRLINSWININNNVIDKQLIEENSFKLYTFLSRFANKSIPHKQILKSCFKQFIVNELDITDKQDVYYI